MDHKGLLLERFNVDLSDYVDFCLDNKMDEGIGEQHHILPTCLFEEYSRDKSNIVLLSYEDHVRAHFLLYRGCPIIQFALAYELMFKNTGYQKRDINSLDSELFTLIGEARSKVSESQRERINRLNAEGRNPNLGKKRTEESRRRMSKAQTGKVKPPEVESDRQSKIKAFFDNPANLLTCPHCGKVGGKPGMIGWHFDKCKLKKE